ncbi:XRE family transcriptional regulator [Listeria monocytogenes]|uniref:helix-turn-helix domain-containing protein n=1 Tax=Vagococcus fluvialis TaxID=2738 RepID=UPI001D0B8122|nr:helix-turn-helix transcriptional regulator [Vagococcus fluvialis]EKS1402188.1 XRE family transcriptional regulator [Listeria monocytogenes]EKS1414073.1 XRE family transcriptional regulator [Listeria monocytogenes]EKS1429164.1 XRE family transcriptional regulator [Listeria monocytogenes]EKS1441195.1 XRE family transcriptional regulator [Listeria monocytogenes]EKS1562680.1 XRE family transcriptional regulator [Listeria monocytogenes]
MIKVGDKIQELRKLNHMTAKELAQQIDVSPPFVSAIENNSTKLSLATLYHICEVLNVSLSEFFDEELSPVEQRLISTIKRMPDNKKRELLSFIEDVF